MATFTEQERAYLAEQRLGRLATVGPNGQPHVVPTSFRFDPVEGVIDIGGHNIAGSKKFRDARPTLGWLSSSTTSPPPTPGDPERSRSAVGRRPSPREASAWDQASAPPGSGSLSSASSRGVSTSATTPRAVGSRC